MEEVDHFGFSVEQAIIHIDIDDLSAIFYLFAGNADRFIIFLFIN